MPREGRRQSCRRYREQGITQKLQAVLGRIGPDPKTFRQAAWEYSCGIPASRSTQSLLGNVGDRDIESYPEVRPCCVVMLDELGEHTFEVTLASDEQPVETFASRGAHESFSERVGARRAARHLDDSGTNRGDHLVEGPDELGIAVADQALDRAPLLLERHGKVARLLGDQAADRMIGDAGQEDLAPLEIDKEKHVETTERDRIDVEKPQASVPEAWVRGNSTHVGPDRSGAGLRRCRRSTLRTAVAERMTPSFFSSPTMRT